MSVGVFLLWVFIAILVGLQLFDLGAVLAAYHLRKLGERALGEGDQELRAIVVEAVREVARGKFGR